LWQQLGMRILAFLVLIIGVAFAGGAVYYAHKFFDEQATSVEPAYVRLLVANRQLKRDTDLRPEDLEWREWPRSAIPEGAFAKVEQIFGDDLGDKRSMIASIEPGELILKGKLSAPNDCGGIDCDVDPGMRLISIPIDAVSGVAGFIRPGDHVDILLTQTVEGRIVSSVIMEAVEIRAIDQSRDTESNVVRPGRTATVLVTARQAQELAVARRVAAFPSSCAAGTGPATTEFPSQSRTTS